jgi:hypothetical protein
MKVAPLLIELKELMPPGSGVEAGGQRWTMDRVGFLKTKTARGAILQIFFDVGVEEDVAVGVVIDDILIGGFDSTSEVQDARLRTILEGTLPALAHHAADLRRAARSSKKLLADQAKAHRNAALDHL